MDGQAGCYIAQLANPVTKPRFSIFRTESGALFSCGWSADGQTGLEHYNNQARPEKLNGDVKNEKIVKVSCASDCVLALNGGLDPSAAGLRRCGVFSRKIPGFKK